MLQRTPLFPHVIELNHQARRRVGCSVYLIYDESEWALIDIGYEDSADDFIELIRQLDFPFSKCKTIVASHADVDHIQGLAKAKQLIKTTDAAQQNDRRRPSGGGGSLGKGRPTRHVR
jgi:hydroxyacylglutathione hydrolase